MVQYYTSSLKFKYYSFWPGTWGLINSTRLESRSNLNHSFRQHLTAFNSICRISCDLCTLMASDSSPICPPTMSISPHRDLQILPSTRLARSSRLSQIDSEMPSGDWLGPLINMASHQMTMTWTPEPLQLVVSTAVSIFQCIEVRYFDCCFVAQLIALLSAIAGTGKTTRSSLSPSWM